MSQLYPVLYSANNAKKKLFWWMERDRSKYRSHSKTGKDGKVKTTGWTIAKAKNIGKANATTPEDQAVAEIDSHYEKKLKNHYHRNEDDYLLKHYLEPMLAQKYDDRKSKIWDSNEYVWVQPKFDGFRCVIDANGAYTRKGESVVTIPHILESLKELFERSPSLVLDGELYNHELKDDFNKLSSILRKTKPTEEDLELSEKMIQFHCYDLPSAYEYCDYEERYSSLQTILSLHPNKYLRLTPSYEARDDEHVKRLLGQFLDEGYEGAMVKLNGYPYEAFKRSPSLLKYKLFIDEEFEIVAILEGAGSWSNRAKALKILLEDGQHCEVGIKGNFAFCDNLWQNKDKYIGTEVTVKYFDRTPDNMIRFGNAIKFHAEVD